MLRKLITGWIGANDSSDPADSPDSRSAVDNPPPAESEQSSSRQPAPAEDSTSVGADHASPAATDESHSLGTSELSRTLTAVRRRYVLEYLTAHDEVLTLEELAEWVATQDEGDVTDAEAVAIALHHWHLPKLTEADLVDYDSTTRTVEPGSKLGDVSARLPPATA